jgi:ParB family chromosome partitioning protein
MMSRKGVFAHLSDAEQAGPAMPARPLTKSKSMAAVTKTLGDLSSRSQRADELEKTLAEGQAVVDLEASAIDPSFVQDRMEGDIDGLLTSIREQGQQVPILVRPHPEQPGRYQVAFGHRRLRALKELGLPVKAVVRKLSDDQLVIAQGQENSEREDLTFIEKARFAARLSERFSRDVVGSALSVDKTNLSKMLTLVGNLPDGLIDAIGAAPGVGRPSWQQMADFIATASDPSSVVEFAKSNGVRDLSSADRFKAILAMKSTKRSRVLPQLMSTSAGGRLAQVTQNKIKLDISIDKRATPEFAAFILEHVPALFEEHMAKLKPKTGE